MTIELFTEDQLLGEDIEALREILRQKLGGYVVAVKHTMKGQKVFRGVRWLRRPDTTGQISYPPPEMVTTFQRVNRPGQPRFYCSVSPLAAYYELHAKQGDLIVVSEWEFTEKLWMHNVGFHPLALQKIGTQYQNIVMRRGITDSIPNETMENNTLRLQVSRAFTADVPDGKEYSYKQSIAINESLLEDVPFQFPDDADAPIHKRFAGTVYPAMRMRGDADNLVILPEFVDSSLTINQVWYVMVEAADETTSSYTLLTIGYANRFPDDNIEWQNMVGTDHDHRSHIALEDGHWVWRDGHGRIRHKR
jgi:hypothetical protein